MADSVGQAIASVLQQTYQNWELLILDDGSDDNSVLIAKQYLDSRIKVLASEKHLGFSSQLNKAIELANGKYFARMDADDKMFPSRLEKQVQFMEANPTIDLLGTALTILDKNGNSKFNRYFPVVHHEIVAYPWNGFGVAHPTWLGKTSWFKKWGYQNYDRYEDQDLLLRAYKTSQFANLSEPLHGYLFDDFSFKKQFRARRAALKSQGAYFYKQGSYTLCILSICFTIIKFFKDLMLIISKGLASK